MPFSLTRTPAELVFRQVSLVSRDWIAPNYVRVRLSGDDLHGFDSRGSDDHMRLFFPADPAASEVGRESPSREYTPFAWDAAAGTLDVEFVVHGSEGIAGPWAATAPLGARIAVGGPRGALVLAGRPDSWFLAGDETALPAIRRYIRLMDATATGTVTIESDNPQPLPTPAGVTVGWVPRGGLSDTLDSLTADDRPLGDAFAFVAAEQSIVRPGRALVFDRWSLPADQAIVKGYWKSGEAEYHAPH